MQRSQPSRNGVTIRRFGYSFICFYHRGLMWTVTQIGQFFLQCTAHRRPRTSKLSNTDCRLLWDGRPFHWSVPGQRRLGSEGSIYQSLTMAT